MNKRAIKKCRGSGKSKGSGCKEPKEIFRYGLCRDCYKEWLFNTEAGQETLKKSTIQGKKRVEKDVRQKEIKRKQEHRIRKQSIRKFNLYLSTAWKWCKRYVLVYYADDSLMVNCCTSPNLIYHVTDRNIHVGHFIKYRDSNSTNNSTAFVFENLAPQSDVDNTKHGGKPEIMKQWLIDKHGEEKIEELSRIKRQPLKLDRSTLQDISDKYRIMYKELLNERGIEDPWGY